VAGTQGLSNLRDLSQFRQRLAGLGSENPADLQLLVTKRLSALVFRQTVSHNAPLCSVPVIPIRQRGNQDQKLSFMSHQEPDFLWVIPGSLPQNPRGHAGF
jgi:hypothetical protein